jgi:RNA polymerase sigma-70 factor (ECF subfamily)
MVFEGMRVNLPFERQTISEADLLRLAQDGNSDAFGDLYRLHLDAIYRYVYSRVGESVEAENLTQATFLKAWRALGAYRPREVPFRSWLYRIAHNTVIDYYRTRQEPTRCLEDLDLIDPSRPPEDGVISQERQEMLRRALARLRPVYQQVLTLRFLNGLDYPEKAEVLGRKVNSVRVLQFRALEALRAVLTEDSAG